MATSEARTVDEYVQSLDPERAAALNELRDMIFAIAPDVAETMKYRMPSYEYGPSILCAVASQKQYMSLYVEVQILDRYREQLAHLSLGKSCIRFRQIEALPLDTIRTILTETVTRLDGVAAPGKA